MLKVYHIKRYRVALFTLLLMLAPFLSLYATRITSVSWFDLILVVIAAAYLSTSKKVIINIQLLGYALMIFIQFVIVNLLKDVDWYDMVFRMLRYLFYFIVLAFFTSKYFDTILGEKIYKIISVFSSMFLWVQWVVLKIWNIYIPGFFVKFPLMRIEMLWHATNYEDRFTLGPRPRSIFSEPQIYATFIAGYIAILLSNRRLNKREKILLLFLNISVLVSLSSTGIVSIVVVWICYFGKECKRGKYGKVLIVSIILSGITVTLLPILYSSGLIFTNHAISGRLSGYEIIFINNNELFYSLFGHGMVDLDANGIGFLPSALRVYYYFGAFGTMFLICFFCVLYKRALEQYKFLVLLSIVLLFGTVDFFGIMVFVSMPFIISTDYNIETNHRGGLA